MWKLSDLIGDYEEPEIITVKGTGNEVPIKGPKSLGWKTLENPGRLTRMFKLEREDKFNAFVLDVFEHKSESGHHGRLTVQFPQVKIDVWTHMLNDITEVDLEWAKTVNEIYEGYE